MIVLLSNLKSSFPSPKSKNWIFSRGVYCEIKTKKALVRNIKDSLFHLDDKPTVKQSPKSLLLLLPFPCLLLSSFSMSSLLPLLPFYHLPFLLLLLPLLLSLLLLPSDLEFWSDMVLPNNILVWKWLIVCTSLVIRSNESKYLVLYRHQLVRKITQLNRTMPAYSQNMWETIKFLLHVVFSPYIE